jgi:hypothetical protein
MFIYKIYGEKTLRVIVALSKAFNIMDILKQTDKKGETLGY